MAAGSTGKPSNPEKKQEVKKETPSNKSKDTAELSEQELQKISGGFRIVK